MLCANCNAAARYSYQISEDIIIHYCDDHLPNFLTPKKLSGQLPLITPAVSEPEPAKPSKKKDVVVEAPVEDAPAE
jgi:hypothetical protein